jgi:cysteine-rich repeat protein
VCGDGVKEASEACDDSNTTNGDGCSSTCQNDQQAQPKLTASVDKPTLSTQLLTTNMVTVSLQSGNGFAGQVTLAPSVVDANGNALAGWTVTLDKTTVDVAANGTASAVATIKIPSDTRAASGTIKIDATSSLGVEHIQSVATVAKQISFPVTLNGTQCVYPTYAVGTVRVLSGTTLRFENKDAAQNMIFHIGTGVGGLSHQPDSGTAPGAAYTQTVTGTSGQVDWYCHNRNNPGNMLLQAQP